MVTCHQHGSDKKAWCFYCVDEGFRGKPDRLDGKTGGHPVFLELMDRMRATHIAKGADYSNPSDILSNLRVCEQFGVPPHMGVLVRMSDKFERLKNLVLKEQKGEGPAVANESLEDTLEDLANYALLMIIVRRESKK